MTTYPRGDDITALTFDFWNTLYSADGGAMDAVRPRRMEALRTLLAAGGIAPPPETLEQAYRLGFDAYMAAWQAGRHFGARDQVDFMLAYFEVSEAGVAPELMAEAAAAIEDASLLAPLQLLPGARETIPELAAAGYGLAIISDTSLTPGRLLCRFLEKDGLLGYFSVLTFSDVTGFTKPDRRMFEITLDALRAVPTAAVHVGDTPRTDIAGAKTLGMTAIRCAGAADHPEPPEADLVIRDHREIPGILRRLNGR